MTSSLPDAYRPCVGIMLLNHKREVFVGKRLDSSSEAWQMPQGGMDAGESPEQTARRELYEETGVRSARVLAQTDHPLRYDLPAELVPNMWGGKFRGQEQHWFVMQIEDESEINIHTEHPEFQDWKWVQMQQLPALIVPFKRALYTRLIEMFADVAIR